VEKEDRDVFVDYFAANFGTEKEAAAPEYKTSPEPVKKAGKQDKKNCPTGLWVAGLLAQRRRFG